jgi:hypothetical protein
VTCSAADSSRRAAVALLDVNTTTPESGGEIGKVLEATVARSGEVRHGSELGGDGSEQQQAARQHLCFVTQARRKVRRKRESRGWLGQMSWTMRKNWTGRVEGRWAARARLFLVFYFIY